MPRFKSIIFYYNSPKIKLFLQKNAKFSSAGGFTPRPPASSGLLPRALPPVPQPPAAGGLAPKSPLAYGGLGLRPQTPNIAPNCEFLVTRLPAAFLFTKRAGHVIKVVLCNSLPFQKF